MRKKG